MEEQKINIYFNSEKIKIEAKELNEKLEHVHGYKEEINELKKTIYETIKIHPYFQEFYEPERELVYYVLNGHKVDLHENGKIYFMTEYGFYFSIESKQADTIEKLKDKIEKQYNIPSDNQEWVYDNIILDDDDLTLYEYDKKNNGMILNNDELKIDIYIKEKPKIKLNLVSEDGIKKELSIDIYDTIGNLYIKTEKLFERNKEDFGEIFYCGKHLFYKNKMIKDYDFDENNNILQLKKCPFYIIIKTLTGRQERIGCEPSNTIIRLKEIIEGITGVRFDDQRLIYEGKQLEDNRTLTEYNIRNNSILHLVLRLR